ncbi:MAG: gamma-glutamyl-gamma-aminobutyrate hydrolase family protein [Deltaproteobacteria bacterium]|nr:gamma-glutamyl-gamma-aminobutyrate hydrolase family protein [Deltaproteobacteria bacterium]
MKKILVLQHEAHEGIGAFEPLFHKPGQQVITKKLFLGDPVPLDEELCDYSGIVLMGGSMSANDGAKLQFIADELKMILQAIQLRLPLLGVCLGAQLIAKALGAKVYSISTPLPGPPAPLPSASGGHPPPQGGRGILKGNILREIGWYPLTLAPASNKDPIFGMLPSPSVLFQWHGETFDIPSGAMRLAGSALFINQAFRYMDRVYGLQFHPEMTDSMLRNWVEIGEQEIITAGLNPRQILTDMLKYLPGLRRWAHQIATGWVALLK